MILGNVAAFGGTLINPAFRELWWPLACLHVALNVGLLVMELAGPRHRIVRIGGGPVFAGVLLAAGFAVLGQGTLVMAPVALLGAAAVACALALYRCYAPPASPSAPAGRRKPERNRKGDAMSNMLRWAGDSTESRPQARASRRFPATVGRFDESADRAVIDGLTRWVEDRYREDLLKRPSKHVYVRTLPGPVIEQVDRLRDSPLIRSLIARQVPAGSVIEPMKHTDELYVSNYNKDHGGDQGLFDRHYDGNLRFLSSSVVVRALIYLQSDATYRVVFDDSRVEKAFATYDFGLLDFHRELHWVEGEYNPADRQRILLKCNYLVTPRNAALLGRAALAANTGVFYVVKSAMEYSKSPSTPPQVAVGLLCNLFRRLNNIHPLIPLAFIAAVLAALGWVVGHSVSFL